MATAFAARDILGNLLSGLSIQFSQPFSIGDRIKVYLFLFFIIFSSLFSLFVLLLDDPAGEFSFLIIKIVVDDIICLC